MTDISPSHPSPLRRRGALPLLLLCLMAPPIVWTAHLTTNFILIDRLCFPRWSALTNAVVPRPPAVVAFGPSALAFAVCLIAAAIAYLQWRRTREEKRGSHEWALDVGEGRTRFMALCGVIIAIGFAAATVFDSLSLFLGLPCGS